MGMSQDKIAQMFREQELKLREERRARLLNESALEAEPLSVHDAEIDRLAKASIKRQAQEFQELVQVIKEAPQGYWRRLWDAVLGR